ncbi:MAG: Lrp/AsnC family transcriptional regulator [Desulfobacteraceae bacterium]|nr:MAG: Lrp/AsnC family transcriptional regulator [Desulfobacteraceae bacterium]
MVLDEIDKIILNTLQENGKTTNSKLSKLVGISAPATLERVKRLETAGIITRFTVLVDPEQLGYLITGIVNLSLNLSQLTSVEDIKEKFAALEEVVECYQISGENDFILKVISKNIKTYAEFMNTKLTKIDGIRFIKSSFVIDKVKESRAFVFDLNEEYRTDINNC